jgi:hypothetical protein
MKWNDLPPGRLAPQASGARRRLCRIFVMGWRNDGARVGLSGTELQHPAAIREPGRAIAMTRLTIRAIVNAPAIPVAEFLQ